MQAFPALRQKFDTDPVNDARALEQRARGRLLYASSLVLFRAALAALLAVGGA